MTGAPAAPDDPARDAWRQALLPHEHGGWSFLAEPMTLGLVAFSFAGVLVSLAAVAAFLARRPLRFVVSDRRKGRRDLRTIVAERGLAACAIVGAAALAGGLLVGRGSALPALGLAVPLAVAALAFDLGRRARALAAELAAALAIAAVAAAIALAAGWRLTPALGLWALLAARDVPTILYVRSRLRIARGAPGRPGTALVAHAVAIVLAIALAGLGLAPWLGIGAMAVLAARAAFSLSPLAPVMTARRLGMSEIAFGASTVGLVALGVTLRM